MNTTTSVLRIHLWLPDYFGGKGGIQVFSRAVVQAIGELLPHAQLSVFARNDANLPNGQGSKAVQFYGAGNWNPRLRTVPFAFNILTHALRKRPAMVLTTHLNFAPVAAWLKRVAGLRYAVVTHGIEAWHVQRRSARRAIWNADRVLAVSHYTRDRLIEQLKLRQDRIGILPNTVDSDRFRPGPKPGYLLDRFGLAPNQPVVLTISRLDEREQYKGYDQIIRSLSVIRETAPHVRYILGGRGSDRKRIEALVRELGLEKSVTCTGYIADEELVDFYNLCDVYAMPSKGEGFGIVFLEALACGKPVLAGNKDGSVDAVLNGELGVLVDPDSVSEIAQALTLMLRGEHPLEILRHPEQLRERVIASYGYEQFVQKLGDTMALMGIATSGIVKTTRSCAA